MEVTLVSPENERYFAPLLPSQRWLQEGLIFGVIDEGTACGVLAADIWDATFNIQYLYVAEKFRRRGAASELLRTLLAYGDTYRMHAVIAQYVQNDEKEAFTACLAKNDFQEDAAVSRIYKFQLANLSKALSGEQPAVSRARITGLHQLTIKNWNRFLQIVEEMQKADAEGNVPQIQARTYYDQEYSFLALKGEECSGCVLVSRHGTEYLLDYFWVTPGTAPAEMMALLQTCYRKMRQELAPDTVIRVNTLTQVSEKMVLRLTDNKAQIVGDAVCRYYLYEREEEANAGE